MFGNANILAVVQDFVTQGHLSELSVLLIVIVLVTGFLRILKQPLIIGYIVAGMLVGPSVLDIVHHVDTIDVFAHMGIGLLLFLVGVDLSPHTIKEHGKVALTVGTVQIAMTALLGFGGAMVFGYDVVTSLYIAAGLTFSSTIVIVKLLGDKEDTESLYGKISIGMLIVQDITVMLVLIIASLTSMSGGGGDMSVGLLLLKGLFLLLWLYFFSRHALPPLMDRVAQSQEFLLLFGLGWCFLLGSLFAYVGFSMEIGTLLAGMSFAVSPYRHQMINKLRSLRDFFLVLFFVLVGMQLSFGALAGHRDLIAFAIVLVVLGKPLIVYVMSQRFGFTKRTSLKAGVSIAQISEFSFLLMGLGVVYGHVTDSSLTSVMMFIGLVTICLSTYGTMYNERFVPWLEKKFFRHHGAVIDHASDDLQAAMVQRDVLVFGYDVLAQHLCKSLRDKSIDFVVVDHHPSIIKQLKKNHADYVFAEPSNVEAYKHVLTGGVRLCVSTLANFHDNVMILELVKSCAPSVLVVVVAHESEQAVALYEHGADYVLMPYQLTAEHASLLVSAAEDIEQFVEQALQHREKIAG